MDQELTFTESEIKEFVKWEYSSKDQGCPGCGAQYIKDPGLNSSTLTHDDNCRVYLLGRLF